jgi:HNH endonuclease
MAKLKRGKSSRDVLLYRKKIAQSTIRRYYLRWRKEQDPLLQRCDNENCRFHTEPLVWNDKPLKLILDHRNGNNSDNRPKNLRLLCPHCDSQLDTRGGANKGRVEKAEGGFALVRRDGKRDYVLPVETGLYSTSGQGTHRKP